MITEKGNIPEQMDKLGDEIQELEIRVNNFQEVKKEVAEQL